MIDTPDAELLKQFSRNGSEEAFAALVQRHIGLVYSVALRHTANPQHAQDITQAVFIILARKARILGRKTILPGWLYRTARLTAANYQRAEARRVHREQEVFMQSTLQEIDADDLWRELSPLLDDAMDHLDASDRNALVLRYFQNKPLAEVGLALGVEERAAQKRVSRALEKLRKFFTQRGVTVTTTIIAGVVSANSVQAAPAGLATTVSAVAVAKGVAAGSSTLTLVKGALKIMAWTKVKTAIVVSVATLMAAGTTTIAFKEFNNRPGYYKGKHIREWLVNLDDQHPGPANDEATDAVRHIGTNGLPTIISMLQLTDFTHHNAVVACYILGPSAKPAIPALMKLLNSGYTFGYVGAAMGRIGQDAIEPLSEALTNENALVRAEVARALGGMPVQSEGKDIDMSDAVSTLIACLGDESSGVRSLAASSLGEIKGEPSRVVPALIKCLGDSDIWVRWNACLALGEFGDQATSAIPALSAALKSDSRGTAAIALVQIEPENTTRLNVLMPILVENIEGIEGTNTNYRSTTAGVLGSCGERAKNAVPVLIRAAQITTGYERQEILTAIRKIDPQAADDAGLK